MDHNYAIVAWLLAVAMLVLDRKHLTRSVLIECVGSAVFKLAVMAVTVLSAYGELSYWQSTAATLAIVWIGIVVIAFPSGGHLNPAVTAGIWASGQLAFLDAIFLIGAQLVGCAFAMELLRVTVPASLHGSIGPMRPAVPDSPLLNHTLVAVALEFIFTASNARLALGCDAFGASAPSTTASLVCVLIVAGKLSYGPGACMDPSGAFAGALFARDFEHLALYWAGGIAGAVVAGGLYGVRLETSMRAPTAWGVTYYAPAEKEKEA